MKSFKQWMDARHMSAEEASEVFAKSPGTIRNWRSIGVPESQVEWVAKRAAEYDAKRAARQPPERVSLEITRDEFADWNRAALLSGKIIYDWAIDVLNEAADQAGAVALAREDSEEGKGYRTGAADATGIERLPNRRKEGTA